MIADGRLVAPWIKWLFVVAFLGIFVMLGMWGSATGAVVLASAVILGQILIPFALLYFLVRFVKWSWTRP